LLLAVERLLLALLWLFELLLLLPATLLLSAATATYIK
jgi:hypothetical protein